MKALLALILGFSFSLAAQAIPSVISQLTVCPENQKQPQSTTVTWSQDGNQQTISFVNAKDSNLYSVLHTELSEYGASIVTYAVPGRGDEKVTIFCDAIMTNDDQLLTVSACGNDY